MHQASLSKLCCWCVEAGRCTCAQDPCNPTDCGCIQDVTYFELPIKDSCQCVMFPATQGATSYLTNTHDVLRRGAH